MYTIKVAETQEELEEISRFRYRVYVKEMNRRQDYADHARQMIWEPLDIGADILGIWYQDSVVGTVRNNKATASSFGYYYDFYSIDMVAPFHPDHTCITTKLMIDKNHRDLGLAFDLACAIYEIGRRQGVEFGFIDCNDHLVPMFEYLGYRHYKDEVSHHEYGRVTPMVMVGSDYDHLRKCQSPFANICDQFPVNEAAVEYFYTYVLPSGPNHSQLPKCDQIQNDCSAGAR